MPAARGRPARDKPSSRPPGDEFDRLRYGPEAATTDWTMRDDSTR